MTDLDRRAGVVGGGIGGLAAAIALRAKGWDVTVYEQAPQFTEVGAGLALGPSALAALDALGVSDSIRASAITDRPATVRSHSGRVLLSGRLSDLTGGEDFILIHRAELISTLVAALPPRCLRAGSTVTGVEPDGRVHTASGTHSFDLVVAADGINSAIRQQLWPQSKSARNTGIAAWRWIVDQPAPQSIGLVWGVDAEFGVLPLAGDRTYAYAGTRAGRANGLSHFADWPDPVPALVASAVPERLLCHDLLELPIPRQWSCGRAVLLGDAAHGMRPTLGQGVGMALEDAVTLAATAPDLRAYTRARRRRVRMIAAMSRNGSWLAEPASPIAAFVRDHAAAAVPASVLHAAGRASMRRFVHNWSPPISFTSRSDEKDRFRGTPGGGVREPNSSIKESAAMDQTDQALVIVDNVSRQYQRGGTSVEALRDVSLTVRAGEFVSIVGPSGAGKSTLLHLIGALDRPSGGSLRIDGEHLEEMNDREQSAFRLHHIGFVFQFFNLLPHLSAWENVAVPRLYDGQRLRHARDDAVALLERVGLGDRTTHRPNELSGGQMQRVAIARALIMNPRVVLADEPTGNLDSKAGAEILTLLREVADSEGRVVMMVTHDVDAAAAGDRTVEIRDGAIATQRAGGPDE